MFQFLKNTVKKTHGCRFKIGLAEWYTNATKIPGEPSLSDDMYDQWSSKFSRKNPWGAPGSAPVYGEGCGVNGGNPNGCGKGNVYGTCCGGKCGGYEGGKPAIEHYQDGLFDDAPVTEWVRGQPAEVYWQQGASHRGGYAYRLCKVPEEGIIGVTEACFNEGHLDFYGNTSWIYYKSKTNFDPDNWTPIDAVRTKSGTYPPGSEWAKIELPIPPESGASWAFKDLVQVPSDIPEGDYILSFRWDCQRSAQVWSSCANIKIV